MGLIHDKQINISIAGSRKSIAWAPQKSWISEMWARLEAPARGVESLTEYLSLPKSKQDDLKDVGGFVGGTLSGNRRKANTVTGRDLISLDLDNIQPGGTQDVLRRIDGLGCAYALYSTRKHEEAKPRLRILLPLSRTATVDEYEPLARKMGQIIGIEMCDPSTFEASRLMYWPSCCRDSQYVFQYGDKPFLDSDGILAMYTDWRNVTEWPEVPGVQQAHVKLAAKQGDPTEKAGIVGAFCRVYDIYQAMDKFLPREYVPCDDMEGRFTFTGGSTTGGAVIYDNGQFLYSHHATDPAGGRLVNSFDLVRLHKFGDRDDEAKPDTPTNKLPSYTAMCEFAVSDTYVASLLNQERYEKATQDFAQPMEDNANWISKLQVSSSTGTPVKTIDNICIILESDPLLKNKMAYDEFSCECAVLGSLPWNDKPNRRLWSDADESGLIRYLEHTHGITGDIKVRHALQIHIHKYAFDDVKKYLTELKWDGVKRLDTLLSDYLGAIDSVYTRAVIRKSLVAAVARVMTPGCKYDYMPIFTGPQGLGKSTFLRILGKKWYSESLVSFEGKDAVENIQGTWINEIGELNGFTRTEINVIKQFLSRVEDRFRATYGRHVGKYPRRCVFFGTSNEKEFLRDMTGDRRFWPVDLAISQPTKNVFTQLIDEVPQIWAEAYCYWQVGEPLYLSGAAEQEARNQQEEHRESDSREGLIIEFMKRPVPLDWDKRTLYERRLYWSGGMIGDVETIERDRVCAVEVLCECLGQEPKYVKQTDTRAINAILRKMLRWKECNEKFGSYGQQRGFKKSIHLV